MPHCEPVVYAVAALWEGVGEHSSVWLEDQQPYYVTAAGRTELKAIHANPDYVTSFDNIFWALLSIFIVWIGVGWTNETYEIKDAYIHLLH